MPTKAPGHIAVNTRLLLPNRLEGIGRFAYEILKRVSENHPETRFSFLFDRRWDPQFIFAPNVRGLAIPPQSRHPLLWYASLHGTLPLALNWLKPNVFFSPEFFLPAWRGPMIGTFHDLGYEHFPADVGGLASKYYQHFSPRYARSAAQILTVSEYTKNDIIDTYGIAAERISVVYNASGGKYGPASPEQQERTRQQFTGGKPYFLYVGAIQPRKNLGHLLLAFDAFKQATGADTKLVLAGRAAWESQDTFAVYNALAHKADVVLTGYVPDATLNALYGSALALTYVPRFEGFGMPVLEAMYTDTPVICSDSTSLPEVAGNAALLVPHDQPQAIAAAMQQLWAQPALREALITRGRTRREAFSWDASAQVVWEQLVAASAVHG